MKKIYALFTLIIISLLLSISIWEFYIEEMIFPPEEGEQVDESYDEKIEYVVTVTTFGVFSLILPFYISIKTEKRRRKLELEREELIEKLQDTIAEVKKLHGIIPICSYCNKIRNESGAWDQLEKYIHEHSGASFSHGVCPQCYEAQMKQINEE